LQGIKDTVADAAPRHKLEKRYPYSDFWVLPRDPTMLRKIDVSDHHLRPVFLWLPELSHPRAVPGGRPPCPRCKHNNQVIVKGWTQKDSRRAILRDSCCDLLGKFYLCRACVEKNTHVSKASDVAKCVTVGWIVAPSVLPLPRFLLWCNRTKWGE